MTSFLPLPDRPASNGAELFRRCQTDLLRLLGVEPGPTDHLRSLIRAELLRRTPLPEDFFIPLITAAVHDPDPSFSRHCVEPALKSFGRRRVQSALLDRLRTGTNLERAGAARAWYWTGLPVAAGEDAPDVVTDWHEAALREFISNDDLDVRRCLIPGLRLHPGAMPSSLSPLVDAAIETARSHPDAYIRHRVEVQVHA
ncbi:hypothetical protein ACVNF4_12835 [Streptomyces sp. S6]